MNPADAQEPPQPEQLQLDSPVTRLLDGEGFHRYSLPPSGTELLVEVENLGRATILGVLSAEGELLFRAANWRGHEGRYRALVPAINNPTVIVAPDEAIAPAGDYRIAVTTAPLNETERDGEAAMTAGSNALLQHFFGAVEGRDEAIEQFTLAIDAFRRSNNKSRLADALFERAGAYYQAKDYEKASADYESARELWNKLHDEAGVASAQLQLGLIAQADSRLADAILLFTEAERIRRERGDEHFLVQVENNLGLVYREAGNTRSAIAKFQSVLENYQGGIDLLGAEPSEADLRAAAPAPRLFDAVVAINNLAWATELFGHPLEAKSLYQRALYLSQFVAQGGIAAQIKSNLARVRFQMGDLDEAIDLLNEARDFFIDGSRDALWAGQAHHGLGEIYRAVGDHRRAQIEFTEALRLRTLNEDRKGRAGTLLLLAEIAADMGEYEEALSRLKELEQMSVTGRPGFRLRARALSLRGRVVSNSGDYEAALESHNSAVRLYQQIKDARGEASAQLWRAETLFSERSLDAAADDLESANELAKQTEDQFLEFRARTALAQKISLEGDYSAAVDEATNALALSEQLRRQIVDPALLRFFATTQRDVFDVIVDAELERGNISAAWAAADRARARRLSELIATITTDQGTAERREQQLALAARREELSELLGNTDPTENAARINTVRAELASTVARLERLQQTGAATANIEDSNLQRVQSGLGAGEALVEFHVSERGAVRWVITSSTIHAQRLDNWNSSDEIITTIYEAVRQRATVPAELLDELSRQLLGDIPDWSAIERLIVVPDGRLNVFPFAMLPDPDSAEPIIANRSLAYLPSAATLGRLDHSARHGSGIAVLADPLYENNYAPLPGTRVEASAIQSAAGANEVEVKLGAEASRDFVIGGGIEAFDIVHFATHGSLDLEEPAMSSLVLSEFTAGGEPQLQHLRMQDVAALDLAAELVVLSGCDTGSGRLIRGDGVDSLSRAFLHAGAKSVVSSHWAVGDRATAQLMQVFYEEMLRKDRSAVDALAAAQNRLRDDPTWSHPYYWAAFGLQGDWRVRGID